MKTGRITLAAVACIFFQTISPASSQDKKLVVAADVGFPPYVMKAPNGDLQGISIDMLNYVAKKLGRNGTEVIDQEYSGIIVGLNAGKYDLVISPTHVTEKRAESVLYTEPFQEANLGVLTMKDHARFNSIDDLRGVSIAVVRGSATDAFLTEREAEYKWSVVRYGKTADAVQAVLSGREAAHIAGESSVALAAKLNDKLRKDVSLPTGLNYAWIVRQGDVELRNKIEDAIECMKKDGALAASIENWFGEKPAANSIIYKPLPGYGAESFKGYDPTPHELTCGG